VVRRGGPAEHLAQIAGLVAQALEVARPHDLRDLPGLMRVVNLDPQLGHLLSEHLFAGVDLPDHALE
jgi:hypothetical protein